MIKITITCEDYYAAESLFDLGGLIETDDILDAVYENGESTTYTAEHFNAVIEKVNPLKQNV